MKTNLKNKTPEDFCDYIWDKILDYSDKSEFPIMSAVEARCWRIEQDGEDAWDLFKEEFLKAIESASNELELLIKLYKYAEEETKES